MICPKGLRVIEAHFTHLDDHVWLNWRAANSSDFLQVLGRYQKILKQPIIVASTMSRACIIFGLLALVTKAYADNGAMNPVKYKNPYAEEGNPTCESCSDP